MGSPRIPEDKPLPAPPPPPTEIAEELKTPQLKKRRNTRKRGASALTVRRPSINV